MNDTHIEAGVVDTLETAVAESLYSKTRPNILTDTTHAAEQFAYTIVERLRRAGMSDAEIRRVLVETK